MLIRSIQIILVTICLLIGISSKLPLMAQTTPLNPIQYFYDKDGRLIKVNNADGTVTTYQYDAANNIIQVTNSSSATFAITSYSPGSGVAGTAVTIVGSGFNSPIVTFNGLTAAITSSSSTSITITVPQGASSGPLAVKVGNQTLTAGTFLILGGAPILTNYALPSAQPGGTVVLSGTNFDATSPSVNTVLVGGIPATVTAVTPTQITFNVPASTVPNNPPGSPGTGQSVSIQTAAGSANAPNLLYVVPRIAFNQTLLPGQGVTGNLSSYGDNGLVLLSGNSNQTISVSASNVNGSGFLQLFLFAPDNSLVQVITVNPTPFGNVVNGSLQTNLTLALPNTGQYVLQSAFQYDASRGFQATGTVSFGAAPTLGNFSVPTAQPGNTITLAGSGFNLTTPSANTVNFGGVQATVTGVSATSITFIVPSLPVVPNPSGTPGTPTTVTVTAGGTAVAPRQLYLVRRIVFNTENVSGTVITGNLTAPGDNGLIRIPGAKNYFDLTVNATNVTGSGSLKVFVFKPDGTLQQTLSFPSNGFSQLNNGTFNGLLLNVDLTLPGTYVVQTTFDENSATGASATGNLAITTTTYSNKANDAVTIFNPDFISSGVTKVTNQQANNAVTLFNPANLSPGITNVTNQKSNFAVTVFNPDFTGPGESTITNTKANNVVTIFNPNTINPGTTTVTDQKANFAVTILNPIAFGSGTSTVTNQKANFATTIFNPGVSGSGISAISDQKANDAVTLFNPNNLNSGITTVTFQKANFAFTACNPSITQPCP
jgi:YD repeat-containing protein